MDAMVLQDPTCTNPKGFTRSESNHSLFVKNMNPSLTAILVYVDDVILARNDSPKKDCIKKFMDDF